MSNLAPGVTVSDLPGNSAAEMWVADRAEELVEDDGLSWVEAVEQAWLEWDRTGPNE